MSEYTSLVKGIKLFWISRRSRRVSRPTASGSKPRRREKGGKTKREGRAARSRERNRKYRLEWKWFRLAYVTVKKKVKNVDSSKTANIPSFVNLVLLCLNVDVVSTAALRRINKGICHVARSCSNHI